MSRLYSARKPNPLSEPFKRIIGGAVYGLAIILSLVWWPYAFVPLTAFAIIWMLGEFYSVSMGDALKPERILAITAAVLCFVLLYAHLAYGFPVRFMLVAAIPLIACLAMPVFRRDAGSYDRFAFIFVGLVWVALPLVLSPCLVFKEGEFDGWLLMDFFIIIWVADVGAYALGTAFGQKPTSRKLAPAISPKKSWWGFWSALGFGTAASVLLSYLGWLQVPMVHAAVLGLILSAAAVLGDLCESVWKRHFGVKDSGTLIPGHGGLLDRMDSSLIAMPLAAAYLAIFSLI